MNNCEEIIMVGVAALHFSHNFVFNKSKNKKFHRVFPPAR